MNTLWNAPSPSSGFHEQAVLDILPKRVCSLSFSFEGDLGVPERVQLLFEGVVAFKCTYMYGLTVEMIASAYDRVVELPASPWLVEAKSGRMPLHAKERVRHLRVCFDDGPCYEFLCTEFRNAIQGQAPLPRGERSSRPP